MLSMELPLTLFPFVKMATNERKQQLEKQKMLKRHINFSAKVNTSQRMLDMLLILFGVQKASHRHFEAITRAQLLTFFCYFLPTFWATVGRTLFC